MLSFECIKNEKSVYFLLTSAISLQILGVERHKHSIYPNGSVARKVLLSHKIFHKGAKSIVRPPVA